MTATNQDFDVPQRSARTLKITVTDDADNSEDLSSFDLEWRLSGRYGDTDIVTKGPGSSDITVTATVSVAESVADPAGDAVAVTNCVAVPTTLALPERAADAVTVVTLSAVDPTVAFPTVVDPTVIFVYSVAM